MLGKREFLKDNRVEIMGDLAITVILVGVGGLYNASMEYLLYLVLFMMIKCAVVLLIKYCQKYKEEKILLE